MVKWEMSWSDVTMYLSTTPVHDWKKGDSKGDKKTDSKPKFVSKEEERETLKRALKL